MHRHLRTDNYKKKYEEAKAELAKSQKAGKLKEEEYRKKLNELEDQYDNALKNLDNYIDQFARIDLSEVSVEEQRILNMVQNGQIEEAVKAYDELGIIDKIGTEAKSYKNLDNAALQIEDEKDLRKRNIEQLFEAILRQVNFYILSDKKKEIYDILTSLLETITPLRNQAPDKFCPITAKAYLLLGEYADMPHIRRKYLNLAINEYESFTNNNSLENLCRTMFLAGKNEQEYAKYEKSSEFLKSALNYCDKLYILDSIKYRIPLVQIKKCLASSYNHLYNKDDEALRLLLEAKDNLSPLLNQDSIQYFELISDIENDLGNTYYHRKDFSNAESSYQNALTNASKLVNFKMDIYGKYRVESLANLASLYNKLNKSDMYEKYKLLELNTYEQLFQYNPEQYDLDLFRHYKWMCDSYNRKTDKSKAMEYNAKAENLLDSRLTHYTQKFQQGQEKDGEKLAEFLNSIAWYYFFVISDNNKAVQYFLKVLNTYKQLSLKNAEYKIKIGHCLENLSLLSIDSIEAKSYLLEAIDYYIDEENTLSNTIQQSSDNNMESMAKLQSEIGSLYNKLEDSAKAEEFYLKALENYTQLYNKDPDKYSVIVSKIEGNLGSIYTKLHNNGKAIEYYEKARENYITLCNQGLGYENLGEISEKTGDAYFQLACNTDSFFNSLPTLNKEVNKVCFDKVNQYYLEALSSYNQMTGGYLISVLLKRQYLNNIYSKLSILHANIEDFSNSLEYINQAINFMPNNPFTYDIRGQILLMKGDEQEAVKMWQKVLELDPDFLKTHDSDLYKLLKEKGLIEQ